MKASKNLKRLLIAWSAAISIVISSVPFVQYKPVSATDLNIIQNNTFWKDTSGKNIYSQGGGIFKFGDTYYWYGVHYGGADTYAANPSKKNNDTSFKSVTCYSSKDLVNWKFENDVLSPKSKGFNWAYWVGRMGVCYNKKTKKYVLITQYNDSILFASCDSPTGNFEVKNVQDQIPGVLKQGTGDQTIFIDDDGTPYIICSNKGGRGHQYVVPLRTSDYLAAESAIEVSSGNGREGNCMFKYNGKYYFCASDLHGWNSSHSYYMVADKITGPYTKWSVMSGTDNDFSHVTQTGFFYTVKGSKQETVIFCGDRWSDFAGNGIGYNQWCPLTINGNNVLFNSLSQWHLNDDTGEWKTGNDNNYILNPSFEADRISQEKLAGWTNSGTGNSNSTGARTGRWCMQQYSASAFKGTMSQTVAAPNGTYTLKAWAKSSGGQKSSSISVKNYGGADKNVSIKDIGGNWKEISISDIKITNGKCEIGISSDGNSGNWIKVDDFTLIAKSTNVSIEPTTNTPAHTINDGKLIKSVKVNDVQNEAAWLVDTNLTKDGLVFGDRNQKFVNVPASLNGAEVLRTACNSKKYQNIQASFLAGNDIMVYTGADERITNIGWLSDWSKTAQTLTDNGNPAVTYRIYKKSFKKGETVSIGTLGTSDVVNYVIAVKKLSDDTTVLYDSNNKFIIGDLNSDGSVDNFDIPIMRKSIFKGSLTESEIKIADVNSDGKINDDDLKMLQDFIIGKINGFTENQRAKN